VTQSTRCPPTSFFAYAAELLKVNPPHITDQPIIAQMKRIGIEPGKSFDLDKADPAVRNGLAKAPEEAQQLMAWKVPTLARVVNGWSMNTDTMGVYGNYYVKRAIVSQMGLGANLPEDAIYPINLADEAGKPLDGANKYALHFDKGATPPANAFWSVTLYDVGGYQVANSLNRFAVSSWMPFKYNADGSLELYFQNESPGADKEASWLPAPRQSCGSSQFRALAVNKSKAGAELMVRLERRHTIALKAVDLGPAEMNLESCIPHGPALGFGSARRPLG
jgi:hypothetical protein